MACLLPLGMATYQGATISRSLLMSHLCLPGDECPTPERSGSTCLSHWALLLANARRREMFHVTLYRALTPLAYETLTFAKRMISSASRSGCLCGSGENLHHKPELQAHDEQATFRQKAWSDIPLGQEPFRQHWGQHVACASIVSSAVAKPSSAIPEIPE